jgi:hypothetical protein
VKLGFFGDTASKLSNHAREAEAIRFRNRQFGLRRIILRVKALAIGVEHALKVDQLRRYCAMINGEPCGPYWELTFHKKR